MKYYLDEDKTAKLVAQLEEGGIPDKSIIGHVDSPKPNQNTAVYSIENQSPTLRRQHGYGIPKFAEPQMLGHLDMKGNDQIKRVYSAESVGPTLTTMGGGHREPKIAEEVRPVLTPDRMEKRQNGRRFKNDGEPMFTLTSQDRHGVATRWHYTEVHLSQVDTKVESP